MKAWLRIKSAAEYADVSPRTVRKWLKEGLKHARLPSGTILVKAQWIDGYLEGFSDHVDIDQVVNDVLRDLTNGRQTKLQ